MFRALAVIFLTSYILPYAAGATACANGKMDQSNADKIVNFINERRIMLINGTQANGTTPNSTLPIATEMGKIVSGERLLQKNVAAAISCSIHLFSLNEDGVLYSHKAWNCDLESRAMAKLGQTCLNAAPSPPLADNAGFFFYYEYSNFGLDNVVSSWLAEIDTNGIESKAIATDVVNYENNALRNYANLVRSTTSAIGCYELSCQTDIQYNIYCITDQPELKTGETIYKVGTEVGGCKNDTMCNGGTCDTATGLCNPTTTTTTTSTTTTTTTTTTPSPAVFPSPGANTRCPTSTVMTDALRTKFLDMHNNRRQLLATGQVAKRNGRTLPQAANMQRMRYNCAMEANVGDFLRTCPTAGTPESARSGGENFISIPESGIADFTAAVQKAVTSWWKVIRTTEGIGMAVTFRAHHVNAPIASFTQMAWATTRKMGCGVAKCPGRYVAACRYSPKGNFVEQVVYVKGAPCTSCPSGAWCTNNALCTLP